MFGCLEEEEEEPRLLDDAEGLTVFRHRRSGCPGFPRRLMSWAMEIKAVLRVLLGKQIFLISNRL